MALLFIVTETPSLLPHASHPNRDFIRESIQRINGEVFKNEHPTWSAAWANNKNIFWWCLSETHWAALKKYQQPSQSLSCPPARIRKLMANNNRQIYCPAISYLSGWLLPAHMVVWIPVTLTMLEWTINVTLCQLGLILVGTMISTWWWYLVILYIH